MSEHPVLLFVVYPLAAYVVGATPFGVLIARAHGVNLREHGSGNVGATNVGRVLGARWGYLCFALDVLKGLLPTLAAGWLLTGLAGRAAPAVEQQISWVLVALAAVLGHVLNFYLGFRGGKGVATGLGAVLGVWPFLTVAGLAALALWIGVTLLSRHVSLGSIMAALAFGPMFVAWNWWVRDWQTVVALWPLGALALMVEAVVLIRHRSNMTRLLAGTENRIGARKADRA